MDELRLSALAWYLAHSDQTVPEELTYIHPQLRTLAVPVESLTPDPKNARKRDQRAMDTLKASIVKSGFRSVIIVQRNDASELIVRAGNGRLQAVSELGYTHIPALVYDESDDEAVAHAIADNRTAELAEWDFKNLSDHLSALEGVFDVADLGWSTDERDKLMVFSLETTEPQPESHRVSTSTPVDPDAIPDYEEEKDFYMIKIEKIPPAMKDGLLELLNTQLAEVGDGSLKARAY